MGEVAEYVDVMERKREVGAELDELLVKRRGLAETSRKVADGWLSDEQRDAVLQEYNRLVSELDSHAGRLRWQLEVLDHELDELSKEKHWYD